MDRYAESAKIEIQILEEVSRKDPEDKYKIVKYIDNFQYLDHICIVCGLCATSVYDFLTKNKYHPFSMKDIQSISYQLIHSLSCKYSQFTIIIQYIFTFHNHFSSEFSIIFNMIQCNSQFNSLFNLISQLLFIFIRIYISQFIIQPQYIFTILNYIQFVIQSNSWTLFNSSFNSIHNSNSIQIRFNSIYNPNSQFNSFQIQIQISFFFYRFTFHQTYSHRFKTREHDVHVFRI